MSIDFVGQAEGKQGYGGETQEMQQQLSGLAHHDLRTGGRPLVVIESVDIEMVNVDGHGPAPRGCLPSA